MKWNIVPPIRESIESILQSSVDVIMYCFFYTIDVVGMQKGELFYEHTALEWRCICMELVDRRWRSTIAECFNSYCKKPNAIFLAWKRWQEDAFGQILFGGRETYYTWKQRGMAMRHKIQYRSNCLQARDWIRHRLSTTEHLFPPRLTSPHYQAFGSM